MLKTLNNELLSMNVYVVALHAREHTLKLDAANVAQRKIKPLSNFIITVRSFYHSIHARTAAQYLVRSRQHSNLQRVCVRTLTRFSTLPIYFESFDWWPLNVTVLFIYRTTTQSTSVYLSVKIL